MNITHETIVGELVADDYRTASVFKRHGIDFCCNGNRTIADACSQKAIESDGLIRELEEAVRTAKKERLTINPGRLTCWPITLKRNITGM